MYKGLLIHNLLCSEFVELTLILIHNQADFGGHFRPVVGYRPLSLCPREEGVCCRRLEAVCVIDLALWLAVAGIRAWSGTLTAQFWSW